MSLFAKCMDASAALFVVWFSCVTWRMVRDTFCAGGRGDEDAPEAKVKDDPEYRRLKTALQRRRKEQERPKAKG